MAREALCTPSSTLECVEGAFLLLTGFCWELNFLPYSLLFSKCSTVLLFTASFPLILVVAMLKVTPMSKSLQTIFDSEIFPGLHWGWGLCPVFFFKNHPQCLACATTHSRCFILSTAVSLAGTRCPRWWLHKWVDRAEFAKTAKPLVWTCFMLTWHWDGGPSFN